ncbi:ImmA/IrrE family metallo-endopeptidase [Nocardioides sp. InS609-2]|uniref:ImmA/IrrE family metallo-endopeptidase n=1 Tax=Nocardioides sp. InS609-2 TaxID=2760705 RepID=UPI0020BE94D6|nr:ImmA/IrrE family metallo-endopeptidase [Nocardioides sp. InS609-2]
MADREGVARAVTYDPGRDAAERYPDWVIRHRPLSHGIPEVLCRRRRVILIASHQDWASKRSSLAHAVAHLDLGHCHETARFFNRQHEVEANQMAARRLISLPALADALCWTRDYHEIAGELDVDVELLKVRETHLHATERGYLRRAVSNLEASA